MSFRNAFQYSRQTWVVNILPVSLSDTHCVPWTKLGTTASLCRLLQRRPSPMSTVRISVSRAFLGVCVWLSIFRKEEAEIVRLMLKSPEDEKFLISLRD